MKKFVFLLVLIWPAIRVGAQAPAYKPDPMWTPRPELAARTNPLTGSSNAAGGRKLYLRHCAECHGKDAEGSKKRDAPGLTLDSVQRQSDGTLFWKITNGKADGDMPGFGRLPELQRWQLVLYIRGVRIGR